MERVVKFVVWMVLELCKRLVVLKSVRHFRVTDIIKAFSKL